MTIQTLDIGKTAYPDLAYAPAAHRPLDQLSAGNISKRLVVFTPGGSAVADLLAEAERSIGPLASVNTVHNVASFNPDNFWAISRKSRYKSANQRGEGFIAFLMLNARGFAALGSGSFNGADPDIGLLAAQNEKPAAIYVWCLYAPGVLAGGIPLVFEKISTPLYRDVPLFARAVTESGRQFLETIGFRPGARIAGKLHTHLHAFPRQDDTSAGPAYDTYRSFATKGPAVTLARTLEDLARATAIRSAVYMAEQKCPYEEEFDGNDLMATHLIGYVGNEPAATLRLRFFADFVKMERVAVRPEFRNSRIAHQIVKAAIELSRVKGYRRMYGHISKRLENFWTRYGFRPFEGGSELAFSDYDYVEMVLEMDRHPDALTIGMNPYVLIRPEGRWHMPSVLEKSAKRPVTRPNRNATAARCPS